ncbi:c-type cytochrome biogenesis protein CcmI [Proteobacteria bacterium 005FR1]|nr:c-type cytochrome biogenesis protein CcmI [Proteobacteria bacterium 005FR1]
MAFSFWFLLLALLAAVFIAWPLLFRRTSKVDEAAPSDVAQRLAFNDAVYEEQLGELTQQRDAGELSENQFAKLKQELDALHQQDNAIDAATSSRGRFGHAIWVVAAVAILVPAIAFFLYDEWGAADDWEIQQLSTQLLRQQQRSAGPEVLRATSEKLFDKLQDRLQEEPENLNNRFLLARTAVELGDFRTALESYRYILERQPNSPQVVGEMAQVLFMAAGNRFTPEVQQVFDRALEMDPANTDLLGFAGIGAYQSGKYQLAIDYWQRGMGRLQPNDPRQETWQRAIAEARRHLGQGGEAVSDLAGEPAASEEAAGESLRVNISLADRVEAEPGDKVFVYARAWQGAKMPLAMKQLTVADLPATVELNDSMSMVPGMTMSRFPQLEVVARISSSGLADARPGDWQATAGPIDSAKTDESVQLLIDSQIP